MRSFYTLLCRLLQALNNGDDGLGALNVLNGYIIRYVTEMLANYEKSSTANVTALYCCMTVLKAIGSAAPSFLNHCYGEFARALQKLVREHTTPITQDVKCKGRS